MTDEKINYFEIFYNENVHRTDTRKIKQKNFNKILLLIMKRNRSSTLLTIKVADRSYTIGICISKQSQANKLAFQTSFKLHHIQEFNSSHSLTAELQNTSLQTVQS